MIQSKAMDISTSKMLSFSNTGIGVFLLSICQAFAKRVNLFDKKLIPLANVPSHLDIWAQVEDKLGSVRQFYNRNGFYSVYQDEFSQEELDIAESKNQPFIHQRVASHLPQDLFEKIFDQFEPGSIIVESHTNLHIFSYLFFHIFYFFIRVKNMIDTR